VFIAKDCGRSKLFYGWDGKEIDEEIRCFERLEEIERT
jgi:hypothetical protein